MGTQNSTRFKTGFVLFSLALTTFAVVMGGNIYQLIAEIPNWFNDIPDSLLAFRNFYKVTHAGYFFQTLAPATILCLIVAVILLWNRPKTANKWILATLVSVVLAEVFTGIYFMPRNFILFIDPIDEISTEELVNVANQWKTANYVRMVIIFFAMFGFLKAYRIICSSKPKE